MFLECLLCMSCSMRAGQTWGGGCDEGMQDEDKGSGRILFPSFEAVRKLGAFYFQKKKEWVL